MTDDDEMYASSPCMMREFQEAEDGTVQIFYLYIDESPPGFRWEVRRHEGAEPIEVGKKTFLTVDEARNAGMAALEKACADFWRFGRFG